MKRLSAVLFTLISGIILSACSGRQSCPANTIRAMSSAFQKGDADRIIALLDPERLDDPALRIVVIDMIETRIRNAAAHGGIAKTEILELREQDDTAYATIIVRFKDGSPNAKSEDFTLVKRGEKWFFGI